MCLSPYILSKLSNLCVILPLMGLKQVQSSLWTYTSVLVDVEGVHCPLPMYARRKSQGSQLINISRICCSAAVCFLWQPNVMQSTFASCNLIRYYLFHNTARPEGRVKHHNLPNPQSFPLQLYWHPPLVETPLIQAGDDTYRVLGGS